MNENAHALRVLEFDKIKEMLRGVASSVLGREAIDELQPYSNAQAIRGAQADTSEYLRLLQTQQAPSLAGLYDIREPLQRSRNTGSILDPAEILIIGETVAAGRPVEAGRRHQAGARRARDRDRPRRCRRAAESAEAVERAARGDRRRRAAHSRIAAAHVAIGPPAEGVWRAAGSPPRVGRRVGAGI